MNRLIEPYSRVEISKIANLIGLPEASVEVRLIPVIITPDKVSTITPKSRVTIRPIIQKFRKIGIILVCEGKI